MDHQTLSIWGTWNWKKTLHFITLTRLGNKGQGHVRVAFFRCNLGWKEKEEICHVPIYLTNNTIWMDTNNDPVSFSCFFFAFLRSTCSPISLSVAVGWGTWDGKRRRKILFIALLIITQKAQHTGSYKRQRHDAAASVLRKFTIAIKGLINPSSLRPWFHDYLALLTKDRRPHQAKHKTTFLSEGKPGGKSP